MINIHSLVKQYGNKTIISNLNLEFEANKITALIGPNGAGKSTLLMIMARLLDASSGDVHLAGNPIQQIKLNEFAKQVATLRQSLNFNLRLTVQELIAYGRFPHNQGHLQAQDQQAIENAMNFLGLSHLKAAYIDELSGGQRQMVYLAMILAQETEILLLDEPLNNLDMAHSVQLMMALRRLCDEYKKTVIIVIHDINFAANYADNIMALKKGDLFFSGNVNQVITEKNLSDLYDLDIKVNFQDGQYFCNYFYSRNKL